MAYKLFDINGNVIEQHDLQDKGVWCQTGASKEKVFVDKFGKSLNLIINPEKENNPYAPDLLNTSTNLLADLKTQNTPFFQAQTRFNYDPQYTVVFNGKDRHRYKEKYPDIEIYFAVDWQAIKFENGKIIEVKPMTGVWFIPFQKLDKLLESSPFHSYGQRKFDQRGNAKGSYVLNLLNNNFIRLL
ncbi:hypothetical protein Q4Q35_00520 [Flavivirga aquimarina]|uniref:WG repeat-containing protein n=1 Tax=Flavivirga aquimarina TaxID=2027862 RepID=A0ABT8W592_9FLAO|nr:hypothetical protein [Flavivirga aquimarina]MDO5968278.1 hypothetical protein [Flavivirga aquimarina]